MCKIVVSTLGLALGALAALVACSDESAPLHPETPSTGRDVERGFPIEIVEIIARYIPSNKASSLCREFRDAVRYDQLCQLDGCFSEWVVSNKHHYPLDRLFDSEQERDECLVELIAAEVPHQLQRAVGLYNVLSDDPEGRLVQMLSGAGVFKNLSMATRKFIAGRHFGHQAVIGCISFSMFLTKYHLQFADFEDSLDKIGDDEVMVAGIKILLGVDCILLPDDKRMALVASMGVLFADDKRAEVLRSLQDQLTPQSSFRQIASVYQNSDIQWCLSLVIEDWPELGVADWCFQELEQQASLGQFNYQENEASPLLLDPSFLARHEIDSECQMRLLQKVEIDALLRAAVNHPNLDLQPLLTLFSQHYHPHLENVDSVILAYSLNDEALEQYSNVLEYDSARVAIQTVLGGKWNRFLDHAKKVQLLTFLGEFKLLALLTDQGDRVVTLAALFDNLLDDEERGVMIEMLSESDYTLLLDHLLQHRLPVSLFTLNPVWTASCVIAAKIEDLEELKKLALNQQVLLFIYLLTDNEAVAKTLRLQLPGVLAKDELHRLQFSRHIQLRAAQRAEELDDENEQVHTQYLQAMFEGAGL